MIKEREMKKAKEILERISEIIIGDKEPKDGRELKERLEKLADFLMEKAEEDPRSFAMTVGILLDNYANPLLMTFYLFGVFPPEEFVEKFAEFSKKVARKKERRFFLDLAFRIYCHPYIVNSIEKALEEVIPVN